MVFIWAKILLSLGLCYSVHISLLSPSHAYSFFLAWPQVGDAEERPSGTCLASSVGEETALPPPTPTVPALPHHGDHTTPACQPPACRPCVCVWATTRCPCQPAAHFQHGEACLGDLVPPVVFRLELSSKPFVSLGSFTFTISHQYPHFSHCK